MFFLSSEAISSDNNCYGLPYQDHNYGSAMSPDMGNNRVGHSRGNHMQTAAPQLSRTRITVKTTSSSFPSLAGPPPLERNSCSDDENVVDPLLYTQTTASSPNFVSPFVGSTSQTSGFNKSSSGIPTVTAMPPGGITVCSSAVARPRIKRMAMDDASHSYASSAAADGTHLSLVKPHVGATILPIGSSSNSSHPQKVAVFRRFPGSSGTTIQVNGPNFQSASSNNPPNLVSTSTTGAPTFSGSIVGPGLTAPIIAVVSGGGAVDQLPPPKRPGRPRGARVGGQQQQRAPRQTKQRKKSRQQTELLTTPPLDMISTMRQVVVTPQSSASVDIVSSPPPAAAHESVMPESMAACLLSTDTDVAANCVAEVAQSIENVLQSVSASTDSLSENNFSGQMSPQSSSSTYISAARKKPTPGGANANLGETDFAETYKSLYDRLFKQLGVPDDEDIDLDRPVGASRTREPFVRVTSPSKKSPSFAVSGGRPTIKPENQMVKESPSPKSVVGGSNTDTDESSDDEWAGQDYITRCVCQMTHNDDFMIQCDRCESWQHCDCVGLQKKYVPERYLCELCDPRPLKLTKDEAQKLQMKKLQKRKRQKAARKRLSSGAGSVGRGRPRKNTGDSAVGSKTTKRNKEQDQADEDLYSTFMHMEVNEYTNEVMRAIRLCGSTVGASLLDQVPQPPPCLIMYVTKERRGLVANKTIPPDQPVMEFRGKISSTLEFDGRNKSTGRIYPCVLFYRGLSKGGGVDGLTPMDLCVDARYRGTEARFVRRSCQPNTQVKHVIKNDQLYLLLVSTELIESATELTIPFDYDYRLCNYEIECGCKIWRNGDCPLDRHNSQSIVSPTSSATSSKKTVLSSGSGSGSQHKRRSTTVAIGGGSASVGNKKVTNFRHKKKIVSGTKKAAAKFSKKAVGFKVKLKDKADLRSKIGKYAKKMAKKKKLKPVASADLTRRRSSAVSESDVVTSPAPISPGPKAAKTEIKEEPMILEKHEDPSPPSRALLTSPKPKPVSTRNVGENSIRVSFSSAGDDLSSPDGHSMTREEKKMQHLVEQIARMEEREKRKVEKRSAKHKDETPSVRSKSFSGQSADSGEKKLTKNLKKRGRRPSANNLTSRKRSESQKSDQLLMSNSDRDSDSGAGSDNDDQKPSASVVEICGSPRVTSADPPTVSFTPTVESTTAASISGQRKSSAMNVEPNVAKKRWLRQAMSEEVAVGVSLTSVETKPSTEMCSTPPLSPPTAPPLKKRKLTSNQTDETENLPFSTNEFTATVTNDHPEDQVPLSATEAAEELLALNQQTNVQIFEPGQTTNVFEPETCSNFEQRTTFLETSMIDAEQPTSVERCGTPVQDEKEEYTVILDDTVAHPSGAVACFPPLSTYDCVEFYSTQQKNEISNVWEVESVVKTEASHQVSAPEPRKKVKMSLDEYKKRKRDVTDVVVGVAADAGSSMDTSRDSSAESASAPVTPGPSTPSVQQKVGVASSFIPKIKEGELESKSIRLVNLPDPSTIGKNTATMEELRQRIYGHSFAAKTQEQDQQKAPENFSSASGMDPIDSPEQIMESSSPETSVTKPETDANDSTTPSQHRMSLMDRLRMEFGLEDGASSCQQQQATVDDRGYLHQHPPPPQQYNIMTNPALAMIQNVRNSFQQMPNFSSTNFAPTASAYMRPTPTSIPVSIPTPVGPPPVGIQRMMNAMMGSMINSTRPPPAPPSVSYPPPSRRADSGHGSTSSSDDERDSRETSGSRPSGDYRRNYFRRRSKSPSDYGGGRRRR